VVLADAVTGGAEVVRFNCTSRVRVELGKPMRALYATATLLDPHTKGPIKFKLGQSLDREGQCDSLYCNNLSAVPVILAGCGSKRGRF
jgi:hypothetical protein